MVIVSALATAAAAAAVTACGGASSPTAAAKPDATPDATPKGPFAGGDTSSSTTGDDADDGGTNGSTWCTREPPHAFCADFDGPHLAEGWDGIVDDLDDFHAVASDRSAPSAVEFIEHAASFDAGQVPFAPSFTKDLGRATQKAVVAVDLRVDALGLADDSVGVQPLFVALTKTSAAGTTYSLGAQVVLRKTRSELVLYTSPDDGGFGVDSTVQMPSLATGTWKHLVLTMAVAADGKGTASLVVDGAPAVETSVDGASPSPDGAHVEIGAIQPQFHPDDAILVFDDVAVDLD